MSKDNQKLIETNKAIGIQFNKEQIDLLKRTVAKGTTDDELSLFMHVCKKSGLDPFSRQIYAVKRWSTKENKEVMTIQTGIDGYRLTAERTGCYCPGKESIFNYDKDNKLISATAYVKKLAGGLWHEISATAFYEEYVQVDKNGNPNTFWSKMKHTMLSKVAEACALRKAFPAELSGIYTFEEMQQTEIAEDTEIKSVKVEIPKLLEEETTKVSKPEIFESRFIMDAITMKTGITNKKEWKLYTIYGSDGAFFKTFSNTIAEQAIKLKGYPVIAKQIRNSKGEIEITELLEDGLITAALK